MDRSHRARCARRCGLLLIALTALAGCQGRTPAPAAARAEEQLQRRLAPSEPAPLPQEADIATSELPTEFALLEPIPSTVEVPAGKSNIPETDNSTSDEHEQEFAINDEDASRQQDDSGAQPLEVAVAKPQEESAPQAKQVSADPPKDDLAAPHKGAPAQSDPTVVKVFTAEEPITKSAENDAGSAPATDESAGAETQLPWGPSTPTPEMAAIAKRAEETARRGFDLAERGALYTARAQFIEALRSVAQAMDSQRNTTAHTKALAAGLRALEEVNDFVPRGTRLETELNLQLIVDAHRTPVLKKQSLEGVTVTEAQRLYLTYAQEHLAAAAGDQSVASLALYGLGKVCAAPAAMHGPHEKIAECKAVVFFQAALVVEPRNFLSANELGVLLARFGRLDDARTVLERAVAISNAPTSWRNLAAVCERQGNAPRAEQARRQAEVAVTQFQREGYANAGLRYPIAWLDPASFARTNSMLGDTRSAPVPQQSPAAVPKTAANPGKKSSTWWGLK